MYPYGERVAVDSVDSFEPFVQRAENNARAHQQRSTCQARRRYRSQLPTVSGTWPITLSRWNSTLGITRGSSGEVTIAGRFTHELSRKHGVPQHSELEPDRAVFAGYGAIATIGRVISLNLLWECPTTDFERAAFASLSGVEPEVPSSEG